ncbi:MAG: hypothetical protein ACRBFS_26480 [Aureispira sp.]
MKNRKNKSDYKRKLVNEHVPYELYVFATLRYYAELQAMGKLDLVEHVMRIEELQEQEAIDKCMEVLKRVRDKESSAISNCTDLLRQDMSGLFDWIQNN